MSNQFRCIVDAAKFGRVYHCVSTEATRYYLQGVQVEAGAEGALLIATDGSALACARDTLGRVDGQAVVQLSPEMLKACRAPRNEGAALVVVGQQAAIVPAAESEQMLAAFDPAAAHVICAQLRGALVDGAFPDWRGVVPRDAAQMEQSPVAAFDVAVLDRLSRAIADPRISSKIRHIRLIGADANSPHLAFGPGGGADVFGVAMPLRCDRASDVDALDWTRSIPAPEAVAAE